MDEVQARAHFQFLANEDVMLDEPLDHDDGRPLDAQYRDQITALRAELEAERARADRNAALMGQHDPSGQDHLAEMMAAVERAESAEAKRDRLLKNVRIAVRIAWSFRARGQEAAAQRDYWREKAKSQASARAEAEAEGDLVLAAVGRWVEVRDDTPSIVDLPNVSRWAERVRVAGDKLHQLYLTKGGSDGQ